MKIGFIGAGKVGFTLGKFFATHGITLTGYYSRQREHAREAAEFTGSLFYEDVEQLIDDSNVIFITVVDSQIRQVYENLSGFDLKEKLICHCSGAMTAQEAFPNIADTGAYGYSIHPLFPISDKLNSYRELPDAFFCIEGDEKHITDVEILLKGVGLKVKVIDGAVKRKYHAAASISSNLVVALMYEAQHLFMECGFSGDEAIKALAPLSRSNMEHILSDGPVAALTGPIERNDSVTVKKHIECLGTEEERELYKAAARTLLNVAREKNPNRDYTDISDILK